MSVLDNIFKRKAEEVAEAKSRVSMADLKAMIAEVEPPRGFLHALQTAKTDLALIAEVKKASPSKGVIRADFDPAAVARSYETAGAHALSVLTDEHYFRGSLLNLRIAKEVTALPCLRKDFLFDPYQVYEARAWGADAVLLIVASLENDEIADLYALAKTLGMDVLVEVHTKSEAERALALRAEMVGVNNRNLSDMSTSLSIGEELLPMLVPHAFAVSESALESRADLDRVAAAGARAVLIGTSFCASEDIEVKVKEVMGW